MKQLEMMYDILFSDDILKELFLNFHSSRWNELSIDKRVSLIRKINIRIGNIYGYEPPKITISKHNFKLRGDMQIDKWELNIETSLIKNSSGYMAFDTFMHELRHSFQARAITNKLSEKEIVSEKQKEEWKTNNIPGNYFVGGSEYYMYQPIEKDAWTIALLMTRKMYFLNKEILGEDLKEWNEYCEWSRGTIKNFISGNQECKKIEDEIQEMYLQKEYDKEQIILGKVIVDKVLKEGNIEDLSLDFALTLLSPFAFINLESTDKVKLLKRYVELLKGPKNLIKEASIDVITIGNEKCELSSSMFLINVILTDIFKVKLVRKLNKLNLEIKEERDLYYNMYVDKNHKRINFIRSEDNIFLYFLQPYAIYEREYILTEFNKLRKNEFEVFKNNNEGFKEIDSFYDIEKIKIIATDIMGISYEEYYEKLIEKYKDNIEKDKNDNSIMKKGIL